MKTVKKALDILDLFVKSDGELGVTEIAKKLEFHKSTTHALLATLKERGFVIFDPRTKKYSLGFKALELVDHIAYQRDLRELCQPVMGEFARDIQEDISLNIRNETSRICIAIARGPQHVRLNINLGMAVPVHCGAAGKCLLAFMERSSLDQVLGKLDFIRFTAHTIPSKRQLLEDLSKIQKQGYAESREEFFKDAAALAFPLFSANGRILAVYSIHSTVNRLTDATRQRFVTAGLEAAGRTNAILKSLRQY
jgi:DNA-binding IclR family transcriptional regulator